MNKIIAIYGCKPFYTENWDDITLEKGCLGGTETIFCQLAYYLGINGYEVYLFCNPLEEHFKNNVHYIKYENEEKYYSKHFNVIISNDYYKIIKNFSYDKLYLTPTCEYIPNIKNITEIDFNNNIKIAYLSEYQKKSFIQLHGDIPSDKLIYIPNGIEDKFYENIVQEKEHGMVWSSAIYRGLDIVIDKILPEILKYYPNFKIYVTSYNNEGIKEEWKKNSNIVFFNGLNKKELSELQKKVDVWIYPNIGIDSNFCYFHETFCLTAIENALAKNVIICFGGKDGIETTLNGYSGLINIDFFNEYEFIYFVELESLFNLLIGKLYRVYNFNNLRKKLINEAYNISLKYNWNNVIKMWINEIENG